MSVRRSPRVALQLQLKLAEKKAQESKAAAQTRPIKRPRVRKAGHAKGRQPILRKARNFPPDLRDRILEQLWDPISMKCRDYGTLRACALINKDWLASARSYIFRSVSFKSWRNLMDFTKLVVSDRTITSYVRKVYLYGTSSPTNPDATDAGNKQEADRWIYQFPYLIGGGLTGLKAIELCSFTRRTDVYPEFDQIEMERDENENFATWVFSLRMLKGVEVLTLRNCMISSNAMTALARAFRRLTSIELHQVDLNTQDDLDAVPIHEIEDPQIAVETPASKAVSYGNAEPPVLFTLWYLRPRLQSIYINNNATHSSSLNMNTLRGWLRPQDVTSTLKSLVIGGKVEMASLATFMSALGTCRTLEFIGYHVDPEHHVELDLSVFPNLRTISFAPGNFESVRAGEIHRILCRFEVSPLKTIHFVGLQTTDNFQADGAKLIDGLLSGKAFGKLEVVEMECSARRLPPLVRKAKVKRFPRLSKRGILQVRCKAV
ncbi:unnamed protein product [Somion occarium]|uniref:F-box domain-containing protein n=1 Tax=Somion occarium TaxID=3059160 RepID=A0ABP1DL50_9APHY